MNRLCLLLIVWLVLGAGCSNAEENRKGRSFEEAIVLDNARDPIKRQEAQNVWLVKNCPGYKVTSRTMLPKGEYQYEVLEVQSASGKTSMLYFRL